MSSRRRNIFAQKTESYNYRFGNPRRKRRYRIRSIRRLVLFVLFIVLLVAALVFFFTRHDRDENAPLSSGSSVETEQAASQDTPAESTSSAEDPAEQSGETEFPIGTKLKQAAESKQSAKADDWRLLLVNPWNTMPENFTVETGYIEDGFELDARAIDDFNAMMQACRNEGYTPMVLSAFRPHDLQVTYFTNITNQYLYAGYSQEEAERLAGEEVAVPGTSEHECGLALDIVDISYQSLDEGQANLPSQQWLMEHCYEYGFILRYPEGKQDITGIIYEPWHYRYVGKEYAMEMRDKGLCLEEFLGKTEHPEGETLTPGTEY